SALREAREETGLACRAVDAAIFDIDIHPIPARGPEAYHLHYDVRFLLEAGAGAQPEVSAESNAVRWFRLDEVAALGGGPSIERMVEKTRLRAPA
ncbi:MAG: NUDIX domain-containing protein, partial [Gammaproteobacteria bacterium]|nr:NUDIX domain-containing protein [Gammaproteobacteria bacterium]